jgi:hypothetical protein
MDIERLKDLTRRKAMAIVGTAMTNDEATRQQIAKNLRLEMIEPNNSDQRNHAHSSLSGRESKTWINRLRA